MSTYFRILLKNVPRDLEDVMTGFCFEQGAGGVAEDLAFVQPDITFDPQILEKPFLSMNVYFEQMPSEDFYLALHSKFPMVQVEKFEEENKDWLAEWKKGYKSFPLIGPYWVVPSWLPRPAEATKVISIDPGMAFGTGTHATTQLAAQLVYELSQAWVTKNISLLDVGTGTAILAMLARHQGAQFVMGTEIDPEARRVGRENVELNQITAVAETGIGIPDEQIDTLKGEFDVVLANIIDGALIHIRKDLQRLMKKNGKMILSGILVEREKEFLPQFLQGTNLKVLKRYHKDEWLGFLLGE